MTFEFTPKTIIMMVGPSHCGKTFLSNKWNEDFKKLGFSSIHLSSDEFRRKMLFKDLHKHDSKMLEVSKQAFNLLYSTLDNYTQYPVNVDFAIVDATNLTSQARKPILDIANKNGYNIVAVTFEYKDSNEYYKYVTESENKEVISKLIFTFKTEMRNFVRKDFSNTYKITSRKQIEDYALQVRSESDDERGINEKENVIIFGDIHGDYDTFINAIRKTDKFELSENEIPTIKPIDDFHIILVGDYIDKNSDENIIKTIEFIYKNREHITIVNGNHEKHCYNVMKGAIKRDKKELELIANYFTSVTLFDNNEEIRNKFFELYESSYTFVKDYKNRFIITHAPCSIKDLEKLNSKSLKNMNTIRYPKLDYENLEKSLEEREKFFSYLKDEAETCNIYHIFGHVALEEVFSYKNKIGLDTGSAYGNELSFVVFSKENKKPFISKVKSSMKKNEKELFPLFRTKGVEITYESLSIETQKFLKFAAKNKINFISGTMCPANKSENDLESLMEGLKYYKDNGVNKVILQTKKMGSRCNAYIHKTDLDACYLVTRNGYKIGNKMLGITPEEYKDFLFKLQEKYQYVFEHLDAEFILFDGELLPWNVLGKGLIEKEFILPYKLASYENEYLKDTGFYELITESLKMELTTDSQKKNVERLKKSINTHIVRDYTSVKNELEKFNKQVTHFGRSYEMEYSAFSILKYRRKNGVEVNMLDTNEMSNIQVYNLLGHTNYAVVDFENKHMVTYLNGEAYNYEFNHENIMNYYDFLTSEQGGMEEGVVIKPEKMYIHNVAPYIKVRNPEYLRITYGADYTLDAKYNHLIKTKNIKNKLNTSIYEWELAREMLNINLDDISLNNNKWVSLTTKFYTALEKEKDLDPRL